jgi:hypothetical protein
VDETLLAKRVPEDEDGVPRRSLLAELAKDPRSGIAEVEPGRYAAEKIAPSVLV